MGRSPTLASAGPGPVMQSWLVGNSGPVAVISPGAQVTAGVPGTSVGPPLHLSVLGLQMGQGWTCALSSMHVPPGQSAFDVHFRPTSLGSVVPLHRFGRRSLVR